MVGNRRIRFVIVLDSCCISIGLVFIKDRPVSSFWVLRFRSRVLRFRDLGVFVFEFWVPRFRDRVLRFRVLRFRNYQSCCLSFAGVANARHVEILGDVIIYSVLVVARTENSSFTVNS